MATHRRSGYSNSPCFSSATRFLLTLLSLACIHSSEASPSCATLSCDFGVTLEWELLPDARIRFTVNALTRGWAAIGISGGGVSPMISSGDGGATDFAVAWPDDMATVEMTSLGARLMDFHSVPGAGYGAPVLDATNELVLESAFYNDTSSAFSVTWSRPLAAAAPADGSSVAEDRAITPGTPQTIVWALAVDAAARPPADGSRLIKHSGLSRGITTIDFGAAQSCMPCHSGHGGGSGAGMRARYEELVRTCYGNGWPSAQLGGYRGEIKAVPPGWIVPAVPSASPAPGSSSSSGSGGASGGDSTAGLPQYARVPSAVAAVATSGQLVARLLAAADAAATAPTSSSGSSGSSNSGSVPAQRALADTGAPAPAAGSVDPSAAASMLDVASSLRRIMRDARIATAVAAPAAAAAAAAAGASAGAGAAGSATTGWRGVSSPDGRFTARWRAENISAANALLYGVDAVGLPALGASSSSYGDVAAFATSAFASFAASSMAEPTLVLRLVTKLGGWAALGFNARPAMTGADVLVAWAAPLAASARTCANVSSCRVYAGDATATGYARPLLDAAAFPSTGSSDVIVLDASIEEEQASSGSSSSGGGSSTSGLIVAVTLLRKLRTGDAADANLWPLASSSSAAASGQYVLYAYGASPGDFSSGAYGEHVTGGKGYTAAALTPAALFPIFDAATGTVSTGSSGGATAGSGSGSGAGAGAGAADLSVVSIVSAFRAPAYTRHGALMVAAFWLCMVLGAVAARYRNALPCLIRPLLPRPHAAAASAASPSPAHAAGKAAAAAEGFPAPDATFSESPSVQLAGGFSPPLPLMVVPTGSAAVAAAAAAPRRSIVPQVAAVRAARASAFVPPASASASNGSSGGSAFLVLEDAQAKFGPPQLTSPAATAAAAATALPSVSAGLTGADSRRQRVAFAGKGVGMMQPQQLQQAQAQSPHDAPASASPMRQPAPPRISLMPMPPPPLPPAPGKLSFDDVFSSSDGAAPGASTATGAADTSGATASAAAQLAARQAALVVTREDPSLGISSRQLFAFNPLTTASVAAAAASAGTYGPQAADASIEADYAQSTGSRMSTAAGAVGSVFGVRPAASQGSPLPLPSNAAVSPHSHAGAAARPGRRPSLQQRLQRRLEGRLHPMLLSCLRKDSWFLLHVAAQVTGAALAAASLALIVATVTEASPGGFGSSVAAWGLHQRAGAAALAGAFGQVALGMLRPHPDAPRRWIWLRAHDAVAALTFLAAAVAVPAGLARAKLWTPLTAGLTALHVLGCALVALSGEATLRWPLPGLADGIARVALRLCLCRGSGAACARNKRVARRQRLSWGPTLARKAQAEAHAQAAAGKAAAGASSAARLGGVDVMPAPSRGCKIAGVSLACIGVAAIVAASGALTAVLATGGELALAGAGSSAAASAARRLSALRDSQLPLATAAAPVSVQPPALAVSAPRRLSSIDTGDSDTPSSGSSSGFGSLLARMPPLDVALALSQSSSGSSPSSSNSMLRVTRPLADSPDAVERWEPAAAHRGRSLAANDTAPPGFNMTARWGRYPTCDASGTGTPASGPTGAPTWSPADLWAGGATPTCASASAALPGVAADGTVDLCFHFDAYPVPSRETTYACRVFAFPPDIPLHMVEVEALVDAGAVNHHMILFSLQVDADYIPPAADERGHAPCETMPNVLAPIALWAPGTTKFTMPPGVGLRVGADATRGADVSAGTRYAVLQIHYNNPAGLSGLLDSSGFVVRVRPFAATTVDAGFLAFGAMVNKLRLPANRTQVGIRAVCSRSLTTFLPPASTYSVGARGYSVIAYFLHMHTLGLRIWTTLRPAAAGYTRLIVNGTDPLGHDNAYNYEMQKGVFTTATIQPGDEVELFATFDTTPARGARYGNADAAAGRPIYGCEETRCEMALNFLLYHPRIPRLPGCPDFAPAIVCDDDGISSSTPCTGFT